MAIEVVPHVTKLSQLLTSVIILIQKVGLGSTVTCIACAVCYACRQKLSITESENKSIESEFGARYSVLYELPYYNSITSCTIDPCTPSFWACQEVL